MKTLEDLKTLSEESDFIKGTVEYYPLENLFELVQSNAYIYYRECGHYHKKSSKLANAKAHDIVFKQKLHKKYNQLDLMHWLTDKELKSLFKYMIKMYIDELHVNGIDLNTVDLHVETKDYISDMLLPMVEMDIYELQEQYRSRHRMYWCTDEMWHELVIGRVDGYQKVLDNMYRGMEIYKFIDNYKHELIGK